MYNTHNKQLLIDFMTKHNEISCSIDEWILLMKQNIPDKTPVRSTVYRLMQNLVKEKKVIRVQTGTKDVKYCISGCSHHTDEHLHTKCISCGELNHINIGLSKEFINKISENYSFNINSADTIIYGKCTKCN